MSIRQNKNIFIKIIEVFKHETDLKFKIQTTHLFLSWDKNTTIRSKIQAEQSILDRIQRMELKWYGHLFRMEDSRWRKKIYHCTPHGRRRRRRPQQSWKNQVTDFMRSKHFEEDMAEDRHLWRLGVDGGLLAEKILIQNNYICLVVNTINAV